MDKVLITGFEKFGDYKENITESFSQEVFSLSGYSLEYMIFPVRIFSNGADNYGKQVVSRAKEINAKAIISLGMGSDVKGARIESQAINWVENEKYCLPSEQRMVLDNTLEPKSHLMVDLEKWDIDKIFNYFNKLNIVYEPTISTNANSFCCNALMFRTLSSLKEEKCPIPYLFLHVSCSPEAISNITSFDKKKHLISISDLKDIVAGFLFSLKD